MFDKIADFLGSPIALAIMGIALVALIGVMVMMRMKKNEDDE
jgi:low affinity Fe/Cu permease